MIYFKKIALLALLLFPVLLIAQNPKQDNSKLNNSRFIAGDQLFQKKQYQKALYKYHEIYLEDIKYTYDEQKTPITYPIALCLNKLGSYALSNFWLDKTQKINSELPHSLKKKIRILTADNKKKLAKDNMIDYLDYYLVISYTNAEKIKKLIPQGNEQQKSGNYSQAIKNYKEAISYINKSEPKHAKLFADIAFCYAKLEGFIGAADSAIYYLLDSYYLNPEYSYEVPYNLAVNYKNAGNWKEALIWIERTKTEFTLEPIKLELLETLKSSCIEMGKQLDAGLELMEKPQSLSITNLGLPINSSRGDYFPSITADGSLLIFTSDRPGSIGGVDEEGQYDQDLWYCPITGNGTYGTPNNMGTPANTINNNGISSFTMDGQFAISVRCGEYDGYGNCDIYLSKINNKEWSNPVNLGKIINNNEWDGQACISADGNMLVWASYRKGGYGKSDLWKSTKNNLGEWSEPINLGSTINTKENEESPFLSAGGQYLYFSSNNHLPRLGGFDIYRSILLPNGNFSTPENLGFPINSIFDDSDYVLSPSGKNGYFSSNRPGGIGDKDLYRADFEAGRTFPVTIKGTISNAANSKPLLAIINIEEQANKLLTDIDTTETASGRFELNGRSGKNYLITATAPGYVTYSETVFLSNDSNRKIVENNILMEPIQTGTKIVMKNLLFETGESTLPNIASNAEIGNLFELMRNNPSLKIELSGHTDDTGDPITNLKLSEARAKTVRDELARRGISENRLISIGYGSNNPISTNSTEEGRRLNRRTEFLILEK